MTLENLGVLQMVRGIKEGKVEDQEGEIKWWMGGGVMVSGGGAKERGRWEGYEGVRFRM